jgi:6-carboxyhexanoate--CoA ligase
MLISSAMSRNLYSLRMHATRGGAHLSGAERLAGQGELETLAASLVGRALGHPKGTADAIRLTVEALDPAEVSSGRLPDLRTVTVADWRQGRRAALRHLLAAGVSEAAARQAMDALAQGAAPGGGSMRGAMLVDAASGARLEPDPARGVRVSRMDLSPAARAELQQKLRERGIDNDHVREALVLAAKVLRAPRIVAELCWSDDPDYVTGYVATPAAGYVRFTRLKPPGEERGGRAFFFRGEGLELTAVIAFLERTPLLIDQIGELGGEIAWED